MRLSNILLGLSSVATPRTTANTFTLSEIGTIKTEAPFDITWSPSPGTKTVSLLLRQNTGDVNNLATVATIRSNLPNSGSFSRTPATTLSRGSGYAFQILDDASPDVDSYSGQFSIDSTNAASSPSVPSSTVPTTGPSNPVVSAASNSTASVAATSSEVTSAAPAITAPAGATAGGGGSGSRASGSGPAGERARGS
ncbi:hypothetical protein BJ875DRAFT_487260 [Amylocarpus encephaloides]|uniref:Yeast cell wall synthesis Kre9/Knh1-like N-terminal domain-containing protein n=1 Tax=Amylocarpus encephaloides TaxID=45428 RepID=A0A9P8C3P5_9HELO|nr:hypothetical protein BJ875DRAFT_487260 [Amylocarpus encephaloides]